MADQEWDCIVLGAGIVGSWTAYHLAAAGKNTLLLDQFMLPHTRGSSSGHSRLMGNIYYKDCYLESMPEIYRLWQDLAQHTGVQIYRETGALVMQQEGDPGPINDMVNALDVYKHPYSMLTSDEIERKYPGIRNNNGQKHVGLYDPNGTMLIPSRCLKVIQREYQKMGGVIHDGVQVVKIIPGSKVTIFSPNKKYCTNKLIITTGPWCMDILGPIGISLPIKTMPGLSVYFQILNPSAGLYDVDKFPAILTYPAYSPEKYRFILIFPSFEYPGMVKLVTRGEPTPHYCHPDERDSESSKYMVDILKQYVKDYMPGVDPTPKIMEPCMYTMTPDGDFVIDRHPRHDNIIIGAGFSGHGFCRAPVMGKLLMEMACNLPTSYTIEPYRLDRFHQSKL